MTPILVAATPNACVDCGSATLGRQKRCGACNKIAVLARAAAASKRWRQENPEKFRASWTRWRASHLRTKDGYKPRPTAIIIPAKPALIAIRATTDLALVESLLHREMPNRADVLQEIMLALLEGRTTPRLLRHHGVRQFVSGVYRANFERSGFAISLDAPGLDGRPLVERMAAL